MPEIVPFFDLKQLVRNNKTGLLTAIESVIDEGYFIGGERVEGFEHTFANYLGIKHFVGVGNGLDALRLGLEVLDIGPGDEVLVPSFSFYATWLSVLQVGATPVFVDVEIDSANIDSERVEDLITPKTKAIIAVHLFGRPVDIVRLQTIANNFGIHLIEDCAQSHGAEVNGQKVGTFGSLAAFSFYPTKNLGALGDAGGIAVSNSELAHKLRSRRSYGQGKSKYEHIDTGWNTRLDPIQAAVLSFNLEHLDEWNRRREAIARQYLDALANTSIGNLAPNNLSDSVWHHFVLSAPNRDFVRNQLKISGIQTDIHYPYAASNIYPLSRFTDSQSRQEFQKAENLSEEVFSLPIGPWMTDTQVEAVCTSLTNLSAY